MSDAHDEIEPDTGEEREEPGRPDPRLRPADPAGTQPKWDPQTLLPTTKPAVASGRLWAPAAEGEEGDAEPAVAASASATATAGPEKPAAASAPGADGGDDDDGASRYSRYSGRFSFLLGALLAVGAAAIVLLVAALASHHGRNGEVALRTGPDWSRWKPAAATGADAAEQIAEHVGHQYRLPNGQQLVAVTGGPLEVANLPVTVAIQKPVSQGGDIDFVEGSGVLYRMCGVGGVDCRITYGKPSISRHALLAREALELALYSFRYLGVTQAVVLMPPSYKTAKAAGGKAATQTKSAPEALLFRRTDPQLASAVAHPLAATLASPTPTVSTVARSPDAPLVNSLTVPNIFSFRFQESNQDARAFLVLNPATG